MKKENYLKKELYSLIQSDISIFEFIQSGSLDGLWYWDLEKPENEWMNAKFWETLGYDSKEMKHLSSEWQDIIFKEDLKIATTNFNKHLEDENHPYDQIVRYKHKDNSTVWIRCRGIIIRNNNGKAIRMLGAHNDITPVMNALRELEEKSEIQSINSNIIKKYNKELNLRLKIEKNKREMERYVKLIDNYIITSSTDLDGVITNVSKAFCKISGYSENELIGKSHNIIRHYDTPPKVFKDLWKTIMSNKVWKSDIKNLSKNGSTYWVDTTISPKYDDQGKKIGYTSIRIDVTDKKRVEELSITDSLTKVYNRRHFNSIFESIINRAKRNNKIFSFLMLDIDFFKEYNDSYGHAKGDEVLYKVAQRIKTLIKRADDYCFRLGGEEFGIAYQSLTIDEANKLAEKIRIEIENLKIEHKKSSVSEFLTVSIGMINISNDKLNDKLNDIYRNADLLLYKAKENGRNKIEIS